MNIWVFVEEANGAPAPVGLELLTKARDLGGVTAVFLGGSDDAIAELGRYGAGSVYRLTGGDGVLPAAGVAAALADLIATESPDIVLFGLTYTDRDVAGRLSARLGKPVVSNASDLRLDGDSVVVITEIFGVTPDIGTFAKAL